MPYLSPSAKSRRTRRHLRALARTLACVSTHVSLKLLSSDVQTSTLRARTVEGGIRAAEVMVVVTGSRDRKRAGPRPRGGQDQGDLWIAYGAGQVAPTVV